MVVIHLNNQETTLKNLVPARIITQQLGCPRLDFKKWKHETIKVVSTISALNLCACFFKRRICLLQFQISALFFSLQLFGKFFVLKIEQGE